MRCIGYHSNLGVLVIVVGVILVIAVEGYLTIINNNLDASLYVYKQVISWVVL